MRKVACLSAHLFYQSDWRLYISYCRSCDVIRSHMPFAGEKPQAIYAIRSRERIINPCSPHFPCLIRLTPLPYTHLGGHYFCDALHS